VVDTFIITYVKFIQDSAYQKVFKSDYFYQVIRKMNVGY